LERQQSCGISKVNKNNFVAGFGVILRWKLFRMATRKSILKKGREGKQFGKTAKLRDFKSPQNYFCTSHVWWNFTMKLLISKDTKKSISKDMKEWHLGQQQIAGFLKATERAFCSSFWWNFTMEIISKEDMERNLWREESTGIKKATRSSIHCTIFYFEIMPRRLFQIWKKLKQMKMVQID